MCKEDKSERKERVIFRPGHLVLGGQGQSKGFYHADYLSILGDLEGPKDRFPPWHGSKNSRLVD